MKKYSDKKLVLIQWNDARFFSGTYDEKTILEEHKMALFSSVGYLVTQDGTTTILAAERNNLAEYRDVTLIHTGSIISITELVPSPSV